MERQTNKTVCHHLRLKCLYSKQLFSSGRLQNKWWLIQAKKNILVNYLVLQFHPKYFLLAVWPWWLNYFCNILPVLQASKIIRNRQLVGGGCTWQRSSIAKLIFGVGSKVTAPHRNFFVKNVFELKSFLPFQVSKLKKIQNTHEADLFKYEPFPASFGFSPPFLLHFDKFYICKCR